MSKNFSGNTNPDRPDSDFYQTPYNLTRRLLKVEKMSGSILEPACGENAIVKVLEEFKYKNIASYDLESDGIDFLKESRKFDNIITNPPYRLANKFLKKALALANKKVIMLMPLNYLHGKERFDKIFSLKKLETIYVFVRYPLLSQTIRDDGRYGTGMMVYAWYVFNQNYNGYPEIRWLDNNDDCVSFSARLYGSRRAKRIKERATEIIKDESLDG